MERVRRVYLFIEREGERERERERGRGFRSLQREHVCDKVGMKGGRYTGARDPVGEMGLCTPYQLLNRERVRKSV